MDFDGLYPIEGAKEVKTLMTRYVTRALRNWNTMREQVQSSQNAGRANSESAKLTQLQLGVAESKNTLKISGLE